MSSALLPLVLLSAPLTPPGLEQFEQTLAARDSATAALGDWCTARQLAPQPEIRAQVLDDPPREPSEPVRQALGTSPAEPVGFRHVRLSCGNRVLSEAYNWYAAARVSPEMNRTLDTTDTPFGRVVAPLGFRRERLGVVRGPADLCPAATILTHRALLRLPDGRALAYVVECYTAANLAPSEAGRPRT